MYQSHEGGRFVRCWCCCCRALAGTHPWLLAELRVCTTTTTMSVREREREHMGVLAASTDIRVCTLPA
jgi:hypothetical protein